MDMMAGLLITYLAHDPTTYAFGVWFTIHAALVMVILLSFLVQELATSVSSRPPPSRAIIRRQYRRYIRHPMRDFLYRFSTRPDPFQIIDLERGGPPWNPDLSSTIGTPYPAPRVVVTPTGLPSDWDRPDNTRPIAFALATMRQSPARGGLFESVQGRTAERGTQTAMRNVRGPGAEERMPGGMSPCTFWWLLLEDQRQSEQAKAEREKRRRSW